MWRAPSFSGTVLMVWALAGCTEPGGSAPPPDATADLAAQPDSLGDATGEVASDTTGDATGDVASDTTGDAASDGSVADEGSDGSLPPTPGTSWTVGGSIEGYAGDEARNLKLVASYDILARDPIAYVSPVLTLAWTGSPPTAEFVLPIDVSTVPTGKNLVFLYLIPDANDNGVNDVGELTETVRPQDATCGVWADGDSWHIFALFRHYNEGDGTFEVSGGEEKSWSAPVTGWYRSTCSGDTCGTLCEPDQMLSGAKLYYEP